ncbi:iron-siderophore ABC transporter substrate-binding protein [Microbacterium protaetiae]|uniref:Iron-siderophore ABC transporter substrate-binding protein n=1 Tax=Microbacterium protaetiae TaxID=2509458 RepID=A0A4P6EHR1_9MICO|nr:iron-siderophore ABC transporter substrate-binding protein [Microbacterium protaetiae]
MTLTALAAVTASSLLLAGCASSADTPGDDARAVASDGFPVTISNVYGQTTIESKPERVVATDWGNNEAALALGVVPVAMPKVTYGDEDGDGLLPWVKDKLAELGADTPTLLDETDGYDYEAIADAKPDVILAATSGMTKEQYDTLSKIAPVVTYQGIPWGTSWQDMTVIDGTALGLKDEAEKLVSSLEDHITQEAAKYPALAGKKFLHSYIDPTDLSTLGFYTTEDARTAYLSELGLVPSDYVASQSKGSDQFWLTASTEKIENFEDVQVIVAYGSEDLLKTLQSDPLLGRIPAIADGAVALVPDNSTLSSAVDPSPLSIGTSYGDDYIKLVGEAAAKAS